MNLEMIILVGLPGAGKSTLVKEFPDHIRICQDVLGNRNDCINATKRAFQQGKSVIIDRTNINKSQRRYFIDVAKDFNAKIYSIFLDTPIVKCIERAKIRKEHETLSCLTNTEEKIIEVITSFNKSLELPDYAEGYEEIFHINDDKDFSIISEYFESSRSEAKENN